MNKKGNGQQSRGADNVRITFSVIIAIAALMFEIYFMINYRDNYLFLGVFAVVVLIATGLFTSDIAKSSSLNKRAIVEQYEGIQKSEKASYLLQKKNFGELENRIVQLELARRKGNDEIISVQKSIGKVLINRTKTELDVIRGRLEAALTKPAGDDGTAETIAAVKMSVDTLEERLLQKINNDMQSMKTDISTGIKEMELSLRSEILKEISTLKAITPQVVQVSAPMDNSISSAPVSSMPQQSAEVESVEESEIQNISSGESEMMSADDIEALLGTPSADVQPEEMLEPLSVQEPEPVPTPQADTDPNKMMSAEDIEALLASTAETQSEPEPEPEPIPEPVPMPQADADPNKMMSAEDIEALLASTTEAKSEPEPESIPEPAPMPQADADPNKMMSAEEIEALLASTSTTDSSLGTDTPTKIEPDKQEKASPAPVPNLDGDPNRKMTPEEIEALIAGNTPPEPAPAPTPKPAPKPPMPDLSNPNKVTTPDEIEALLANM